MPARLRDLGRTFAGAFAKTTPGGVIIVKASGEFGPVTITQSVSIVAPPGVYAGISPSTGNGVTVNGAGIIVALRGLSIRGSGTGYGVHFQLGASLDIENVTISENASFRSINMEASGKLLVTDAIVRNGGSIGISPSGGSATFTRVQSTNNSFGMALEGGKIVIRDSVISNNVDVGIRVSPVTTGVAVSVSVERSTVSANGGNGVAVSGATARVAVIGTAVSDNVDDGIDADSGSTVIVTGSAVIGHGGFGFYEAGSTAFKSTGDNVLTENNGGGSQTQGTITTIAKQ